MRTPRSYAFRLLSPGLSLPAQPTPVGEFETPFLQRYAPEIPPAQPLIPCTKGRFLGRCFCSWNTVALPLSSKLLCQRLWGYHKDQGSQARLWGESQAGLAQQRKLDALGRPLPTSHLTPPWHEKAQPAGAQRQLDAQTGPTDGRSVGPWKQFGPSIPNCPGVKGTARGGHWAWRSVLLIGSGAGGPGASAANVKGTIWGEPWSARHPQLVSLVGGDGQGQEEDRLLAVVSPRAALAAPVLLEPDEPILLGMLLGGVGVVMVLLQPFQEQALLVGCL